jgi:hypothetical protein
MCYHKLYLFSHCGHSYHGKKVGTPCTNTYISLPNTATTPAPLSPFAQWPLSPNSPTPCAKQSHPYHTLKIHSLCLRCAKSRLSRLATWDKSLPAAGAAVKAQRGSVASPLKPEVVAVNVMLYEMKERWKMSPQSAEFDGWRSPGTTTESGDGVGSGVQGSDTENGASEGQLELDDLDITCSTRD